MSKSQNITKKNSRTNEEKEKARQTAFRAIKPKPNTQKTESITNNSGELPPTINTVFKKRQLPPTPPTPPIPLKRQLPPTPLKKINNESSKPSTTKMNKLVLPNNNSIRASLNETKLSSQNQTLKLSNPPPKPPPKPPRKINVQPKPNIESPYSTFGEEVNNTPPEPPPRNRNHWSSKQFRTERVNPVSLNNRRIVRRLKENKKAKSSSTPPYNSSKPPPKPPRNYRENSNIMKLLNQENKETTI